MYFESGEVSSTVLVVDNDPLVLLGTTVMLREFGLNPVPAANAGAALAMIEDGLNPAVLVTDYAMPMMDGVALAHKICASNSTVKVLFVSGHPALDETLANGWMLLPKPFTSLELRTALEALGHLHNHSETG